MEKERLNKMLNIEKGLLRLFDTRPEPNILFEMKSKYTEILSWVAPEEACIILQNMVVDIPDGKEKEQTCLKLFQLYLSRNDGGKDLKKASQIASETVQTSKLWETLWSVYT
jgi:hypothetical protein